MRGQEGERMKKIYRYSTIALCAFFVLFHIYTALFGVIGNNGQKCIHLCVIFGILFIGLMEKYESWRGKYVIHLVCVSYV